MQALGQFLSRFILKPVSIVVVILATIVIPISALSIRANPANETITPQPRLLAFGEKLHRLSTQSALSEKPLLTATEPSQGQQKTPAPTNQTVANQTQTLNAALTSGPQMTSTPLTGLATATPLKTLTSTPSLTATALTPTTSATITPSTTPVPSHTSSPTAITVIRTATRTRTPTQSSGATLTRTATLPPTRTPIPYQGSLCGNLSPDLYMSAANSPYVVTCDANIAAGSNVTAGPGTIIKFEPGTRLVVDGDFTFDGSSAKPVILTTIKDDTVGGDTNQDGSATQPTPGDWNGIQINSSGIARFTYTTIKYSISAVTVISGEADLDNSTLSNNSDTAILCTGCILSLTNSTLQSNAKGVIASNANLWMDTNRILSNTVDGIVLEYPMQGQVIVANNTFSGNAYPINISLASGPLNLPIPGVTNNNITGNQVNGLGLDGLITENSTINPSNDLTYVNKGLSIWYDVTVTVKANTVIKSVPAIDISINGTLLLQGTSSEPITFTSIKDDSIGGDTNGDGTASQPGPHDWNALISLSSGIITADYATFKYSEDPLVINGGSAAITHSIIKQNTKGVLVVDGSFTMTQSLITENATGIYTDEGPALFISGNNISGNTEYGFFNANTLSVAPAQNNWWGDASGPKPRGTGNGVNFNSQTGEVYVDFDPWLTSAP